MTNEYFKQFKFEFNLAEANYELDALQEKLLMSYLRVDKKFRHAFNTNYTNEFFKFLKDKARLKEPIHLSVMGNVRSGKSVSSISICAFLNACNNRLITIDYICGNAMEFLEKLKSMPQEELNNSCFLIDEEKTNIMGYGSVAKKLKLQDVANIIAINNISTIMLNPIEWANKEANYGLRTFGRCFKTKTVRFMLYNLQGNQAETPMGIIYLPIFTEFLPKEISIPLEKEYLAKKMDWVMLEQRGQGDVLAEVRKKSAENFMRDESYIGLKKKAEKLSYITYKMGSEWTSRECEDIYQLTELIKQGII